MSPWCLLLAALRPDGRASSCRRGGFISRALPRRGMLLLVTAAASSRGPLPRRGVLPLAWCLRLVGVGPPGLARVLVGRWRRTVPMAQVPRGCSGGSQRDGAEVGRGRPRGLGAAPKAGQRGLVLVGRDVSWAVRSARLVRSCASCLSSGGLSSPPGPSLSSPAARGGSRWGRTHRGARGRVESFRRQRGGGAFHRWSLPCRGRSGVLGRCARV